MDKKVYSGDSKNKGIIKSFDQTKGYGFIKREGEKDIFFHLSNLSKGVNPDLLQKNKKVTFDVKIGEKGAKAINIQLVDEDKPSASVDEQISAGLKNLKYCLPSDTIEALGEKLKNQQIDNFNLRLNKCAFFDASNPSKMKFEFYKKDKKGTFIIKINPNFPCIDFNAINRHHKSVIENLKIKVESLKFSTDWRLIIGLGGESVYETSMTLHHIYGIPYIPGQAIKGVVRNFVINECFNSEEEALTDKGFCEIFGTSEDKGKVIFFDVFPTTKPKIEPDIMNVHYPDYYRSTKLWPTDYQNPNPIFFLTVRDTKFEFIIGIKEKENKEIKEGELVGYPLETAKDWLEKTLRNHGIGAKTAVGYGLFKLPEEGGKKEIS